jgi:hypothetical protein
VRIFIRDSWEIGWIVFDGRIRNAVSKRPSEVEIWEAFKKRRKSYTTDAVTRTNEFFLMICMSVTYSGETWCSLHRAKSTNLIRKSLQHISSKNIYPNQSRLSKENSFSPRNFWDLGIDESQREQNQANDVDVV